MWINPGALWQRQKPDQSDSRAFSLGSLNRQNSIILIRYLVAELIVSVRFKMKKM